MSSNYLDDLKWILTYRIGLVVELNDKKQAKNTFLELDCPLKSDYFSYNLKKRALSWLLTPVLGKNNFIFPKTGVKSLDKALFDY